jgi:hypothetical protein
MTAKAVISLCTGLEDPEQVTVAFLVAVGAAEQVPRGRRPLSDLPDLLQRSPAQRGHAGEERVNGRHRTDVAVDRRRAGRDVQLLR